ncbi:hypothetical protein, partial [Stenotrophomonas sp. ATCM1_4]|uniref:hypothetical protein n=1 Tax=Stenotrophomonas sp. ATCM1_4 TaxID=2259330 RepID=UPI0010530E53
MYEITLGKRWSGGEVGNTVVLSIAGADVVNAMAGSSIAPSTTTQAIAYAPGSDAITLTETFSVGDVGAYAVSLTCNGGFVPVTIDTSTNTATAIYPAPDAGGLACEYTNTALSQTLTKALTSNADGDAS